MSRSTISRRARAGDIRAPSSGPAGRFVAVGVDDARYAAFVPHPLPPRLEFSPALVRELSNADRALGQLAGLGATLPNPQLLIRPFIHVEAVVSSRIEGTQTGVADLYAFEASQRAPRTGRTGAPTADAQEVASYVAALDYGLERLDTLPVSLRLIRELHERLMEGVRGGHLTPGEFRRSQNWIGAPGSTIATARYVPPPVPELADALSSLERYIHAEDDNPPLIRLALIHYQFEAIHPFLDGNGRIGRLLVSLLLVHWELLPYPLLYLSAFFERNRRAYYDGLLGVTERADWQSWVRFFLCGVKEQAHDALGRGQRLQALQRQWRERLVQSGAQARALQLVDHLFHSPVLSLADVQGALGVTYRAARMNVQKLVDAGILRQSSVGPYGRVFAADDILHALQGAAHEQPAV